MSKSMRRKAEAAGYVYSDKMTPEQLARRLAQRAVRIPNKKRQASRTQARGKVRDAGD